MKPPEERLNDQLEQARSRGLQNGQHPSGFLLHEPGLARDSEIDDLVALARSLQAAPQIQADPDFARQLERRILHRHAERQLQSTSKKRSFVSLLCAHPAFGTILGLCLLLVLGTGVLVMATQVSNPNNPLYTLKRWEQHFQISLTSSPGDQASLDLHFARDRLNMLSSLADQTHAVPYNQALTDLDQQLQTAASAINELPAGAQRKQLSSELASLQSDANHILRGLLSRLALPERLTTTGELARLGDNVPRLINGTLTLPPHPNGLATVSLSGSGIQPGAQLLVDSKPTGVSGSLQNGQFVFVVVTWRSEQHPRSLGILNPDGTAVQTTAITIKTTDGNGNKPTVTPTPKGNKPTVTPTPKGNKPTVTPTPHH